MNVLLNLVLPALVPALADGLRGIFARLTQGKGAQPQTVDQAIQLMQAQTERLFALAKLDTPGGEVSRWVANLRGAFRYAIVSAIVAAAVPAALIAPEAAGTLVLLELTGACMSFIIGERMYLYIRR